MHIFRQNQPGVISWRKVDGVTEIQFPWFLILIGL